MDRGVADAIRQQSEDLREELKELEQWEDAMQARAVAAAQRKAPAPALAAAAAAVEPPIRGTVPSLKEAVRQQQQQVRSAGASTEADPVQQAKDKGNALFQAGHLPEALAAYTAGIDLDPASATTHVLYANRAMCHLKLGSWAAAEKDATTCVHMNTGYAKAYYRRAMARRQLGKLREARADLEAVLALAPKDASAQQEMESVTRALQAERAAATATAAAATPAASSSSSAAAAPAKKRIVIEEVESEEDGEGEGEGGAPALSPAEAALRQARIDTDLRTLAAAREAQEAAARQEAQREAAAQAQRQRRNQRVEVVEEVEGAETAPPQPPPPQPSPPQPSPTASTQNSSAGSPTSPAAAAAAVRARARPSIAKESLTAPKSFSEFERRFREVGQQPELRDHYVRLLDPAGMAKLFGSNMAPEMLLGILEAVASFDGPSALAYAKGLCQVRRVEDLTMFFSAGEKAVVQAVLDHLRATGASAKDVQAVERKLKPM